MEKKIADIILTVFFLLNMFVLAAVYMMEHRSKD